MSKILLSIKPEYAHKILEGTKKYEFRKQLRARAIADSKENADLLAAAAGKLLRNIRLFDIYRGVGVSEGKKSMAFSLELRADDRTLTDTDSEQAVSKVLKALAEKLEVLKHHGEDIHVIIVTILADIDAV